MAISKVQRLDTADGVEPFRELRATEIDSRILREQMSTHGYMLIRGLLPLDHINRLLTDITQIISAAGWLLPGYSPLERMADVGATCGDPDLSYRAVYKEVFSLESLHAFQHQLALQQAMQLLVGPQLLIHPKPIGRLMFPNCDRFVTHIHQDHQAIGGDPESFTAWMPLHDCPVQLGPIQVLEGSHRFGLQTSETNHHLDPETLRGDDWASGRINAGDVLIFHSLTAHAGTANVSDRIRISVDCRFQDSGRPINPATLVFPGPSSNRRTWESIYANWTTDDLKYYWKKLPLQLKPSRVELAYLAETEASPDMRSRYARILTQIEEQELV
jgi:ectoine hydroxylase-related dioxygenase (phytanoyl-CoA dioxygenase family)